MISRNLLFRNWEFQIWCFLQIESEYDRVLECGFFIRSGFMNSADLGVQPPNSSNVWSWNFMILSLILDKKRFLESFPLTSFKFFWPKFKCYKDGVIELVELNGKSWLIVSQNLPLWIILPSTCPSWNTISLNELKNKKK